MKLFSLELKLRTPFFVPFYFFETMNILSFKLDMMDNKIFNMEIGEFIE